MSCLGPNLWSDKSLGDFYESSTYLLVVRDLYQMGHSGRVGTELGRDTVRDTTSGIYVRRSLKRVVRVLHL